MSYLALYRKYRPQKFEEVVGQNYVIKVLKNSIINDKISHAYLFSGPRGTGKTTIAKLIAKLVNCEELKNGNPCDNCLSCKAFNEKNQSDIIEMDAASNNGVDEIREIRDKISLMPSISKYKVYIIDEVHMLSIGAFNALLKTLEEPPKHAIFILATTEFYKVPETIISRCQCFDFEKISDEDIIDKLNYIILTEGFTIDSRVVPLIAKYSDGGLRDAINMLDKLVCCSNDITIDDFYDLKGLVKKEDLDYIYDNLINGKINELFNIFDDLYKKGKNLILLAEELITYIKNILLDSYKNDKLLVLQQEQMFMAIDILNQTIINMKNSSYVKVIFDVGMLKIIKLFRNNTTLNSQDLILNKKIESQEESSGADTIIDTPNEEIIDPIISSNEQNLDHQVTSLINKELEENIKIRINNALALANKNILEDLKIQWIGFSDYLYNKEFSSVVSYLIDGNLRVAGEKDVIISVKYDSILENALLNLLSIESLFTIVMGKYYKIAFILDDQWKKIKQQFINDKKNGIIYTYKEEKQIDVEKIKEQKLTNNESVSDIVNQAVSLFGNEIVEIK